MLLKIVLSKCCTYSSEVRVVGGGVAKTRAGQDEVTEAAV